MKKLKTVVADFSYAQGRALGETLKTQTVAALSIVAESGSLSGVELLGPVLKANATLTSLEIIGVRLSDRVAADSPTNCTTSVTDSPNFAVPFSALSTPISCF